MTGARGRDGRAAMAPRRPRRPRELLAHLGPALDRRQDGLGGLQQVERSGGDRRRVVDDAAADSRRATGSTTWPRARMARWSSATNKRGKSVSVFDAASGKELARIPTTRRVPSGLVISPDSRYAFVTLEGVGSEPGTVDVIDLRRSGAVASVDVGQQAGGIATLEDSSSAR